MADRENKITQYRNLKIHQKPLIYLTAKCRGLGTNEKILPYLAKVIYKKQKVIPQKGMAYPVKCAKLLYKILMDVEKNTMTKFKFDKVYLSELWVNEGVMKGIRGIPRARGTSSPKYLRTTNIFVKYSQLVEK